MVQIMHWAYQVCSFNMQGTFSCQVAEAPASLRGVKCFAALSPSLFLSLDEMLLAPAPSPGTGARLP